jgi:hypothetical protein
VLALVLVNHVKCEWVDRHPGFVQSANELVSHESKLLFVFCTGSQRFKFLRLKAWSAGDLGTFEPFEFMRDGVRYPYSSPLSHH